MGNVTTGDDYEPPQMPKKSGGSARPNCPRCKGTVFLADGRSFSNTAGVLIYCQSCGAVIGWGPKLSN